ncbi:MAG TPA: alpha/beta fold hydrolase [Acidimicrobiales bacterium]|nr:alpha/beta fold hydrolase [Acidimicrobiales bacterium]
MGPREGTVAGGGPVAPVPGVTLSTGPGSPQSGSRPGGARSGGDAGPRGAPAKINGWGNGRAALETLEFGAAGGPTLAGYLARPNFSAASGSGRHGVVLAHGFPETVQKTAAPSSGYPQLATRLAAETGAAVLTFEFRGTGASGGDFSLDGWRADLGAGIRTLRQVPGIEEIWLVGFAAGGTLSICAAAEDPSVAGVAALAPPADFADRGTDARRLVAQARAIGLIHTRGYPPDPSAWARQLRQLRPTQLVAKVPPRPLLIITGANDDVVPMTDARELADAADASAELRVIAGAGHMLLHDPRAIALLLGWFDRHLGAAT